MIPHQGKKLKWKVHHVKGYQDQDSYKVLDQWAFLNVEVNLLAQTYWYETRNPLCQQQQEVSGEGYTVWIGKQKICSKFNAHSQTNNSKKVGEMRHPN